MLFLRLRHYQKLTFDHKLSILLLTVDWKLNILFWKLLGIVRLEIVY